MQIQNDVAVKCIARHMEALVIKGFDRLIGLQFGGDSLSDDRRVMRGILRRQCGRNFASPSLSASMANKSNQPRLKLTPDGKSCRPCDDAVDLSHTDWVDHREDHETCIEQTGLVSSINLGQKMMQDHHSWLFPCMQTCLNENFWQGRIIGPISRRVR